MIPMELVFVPCTECGATYATQAKAGESISPCCGAVLWLFEVDGDPVEDPVEEVDPDGASELRSEELAYRLSVASLLRESAEYGSRCLHLTIAPLDFEGFSSYCTQCGKIELMNP